MRLFRLLASCLWRRAERSAAYLCESQVLEDGIAEVRSRLASFPTDHTAIATAPGYYCVKWSPRVAWDERANTVFITMSKTQVRLDVDGDHAVAVFFNESGVNVLAPEVMHSFGAVIARVKKDPAIRTLVVQGEGKVFLAGADLKVMANYSADEARRYGSLGQDVLDDLAGLRCITVAAINGAAMGGGLELALACDFRIAVKSAKLGLPEVSLGVIPGWGGIPRLTKLIGPSRAKKMYLSGMHVSAEEGHEIGLVDEVVNSVEDLKARVTSFFRSFRKASPTAVGLAKRAARDMDDLSAFADCFHSRECREGIAAFLEKRPAPWMEGTKE